MPVYCVDKPLGLSSHDVVAHARRSLGTRRVGHAGTLDPLATGVLLLLTHEATKLSQFVTGHDKSYLAWVTFGVSTPTLDAEGPVAATADASALDGEAVRSALPPFLSLSEQRPPAYSAIKRGGERSYAAARRGEVEEPPPRPAGYRSIELLAVAADRAQLPQRFAPTVAAGATTGQGATEEPGPGRWRPDKRGRSFQLPPPLPGEHTVTAVLGLRVKAGTYVRAFARDLGLALGLPAHLSGLVRTASGNIDLSRATQLAALSQARGIDLREAIDLPELIVDDATATAIVQGRRPPLDLAERSAVIGPEGELVAVIDPDEERGFRVARVFSRGA